MAALLWCPDADRRTEQRGGGLNRARPTQPSRSSAPTLDSMASGAKVTLISIGSGCHTETCSASANGPSLRPRHHHSATDSPASTATSRSRCTSTPGPDTGHPRWPSPGAPRPSPGGRLWSVNHPSAQKVFRRSTWETGGRPPEQVAPDRNPPSATASTRGRDHLPGGPGATARNSVHLSLNVSPTPSDQCSGTVQSSSSSFSVNSAVPAVPPRSGVRMSVVARTAAIASVMSLAPSGGEVVEHHGRRQIAPRGLAMP